MNPYVLPKEVIPLRYTLELTPDFKSLNFSGKENIEINILKNTNKINLNSQNIKITKAEIKNNELKKISYNQKYQTATFTFKNKIKGKISLYLEFNGKIREDLRGWYKSSYSVKDKEKIMLTTQFESTDARKAFPCFDQPDMKAKFSLILNVPEDLDAISNMPVKNSFVKNKLKKFVFEETPLMSTYLLAFVIGQLEYVEGETKDKTKVRVYTTPEKKEKGKLALHVAVKSLEYYNEYFKIPYPLPKLDLIAIPDFESGAMENWGLVTYRETQLLFDEKNSSVGIKENIVHTINHEIAHQWFGNIVTMKWWNDLWLNEGFASWIEYKATDELFPEFDIWTKYLTDVRTSALHLDSLSNSHPIEVQVKNPAEISEIFDAISYNKGSAVIRMLEHYLGEEVFRNGLRNYLFKFKYGNATTDDLWDSLEKISKKPVKEMMHSWTRQTGYPIISSLNNKIIQERFFYLKKKDKQLWHVPLGVLENNNVKYYDLNDKNSKINNLSLINPGQIGFYRVNYDKELFYKLINSRLNIIDKIGMENDFYALSRGCYIKAGEYLKLVQIFKNETNQVLWRDIATNLEKIKLLFYEKHSEELDKLFIDLFSKIYQKVGWDEKPGETHTDILLRSTVLSALGFNNHKPILEDANKRFNESLKGNKINPNIRSVIYGLVAYSGDEKTFELLKSIYLKEKLQEEKIRILVSLGMFKQKDILRKALEFGLSANVRNQDAMYILSVVGSSNYGGDLAWQFLKQNWDEYYKRYHEGHIMTNIIKVCLQRFKDLDKIEEIKDFFGKHKIPIAKRAIEQSIEAIKINYNFVKYNDDLIKTI